MPILIRIKLPLISALIIMISGCTTLDGILATSTPVFPVTNHLKVMPTLGSEIITTNPNLISNTPELKVTQTYSASIPIYPTIIPTKEIPNFNLLRAEISQITSKAGGRWHIIIKEIDGADIYIHQPDTRINIASVVKVPIALLFFKAIEANGISEDQLREYLQATGTGGRTFDQLLQAMLVKSEEDATEILDNYLRSFYNVPAQMTEWELAEIDLVARRYTAAGVANLFERFYQGDFVSPIARDIILGYLNEYTSSDDLRIGSISKYLPDGYAIYNKRGSLLTPYVIADCAIIENVNGPDYIIIMFSYQGDPITTYEVLEKAQGEIALAFWQTIKP